MMRINLSCPYDDKDEARRLGAKWDLARRTWYIENMEDLTPFMKWIRRAEAGVSPAELTLRDYLKVAYGASKGLSVAAANAFGIPYPPESGWIDRYADRKISSTLAAKLMKKREKKRESRKYNTRNATNR